MTYIPPWSYWYRNIHMKYARNQRMSFDTKFYIYRYIVSENEANFIRRTGIVFSTNPYGTYWTTLYTDDKSEARRLLALKADPKYRVGGIPLSHVDRGLIKYQGRVKPNNQQPGGAWEIVISGPVFIVSMYNFELNKYECLPHYEVCPSEPIH